MAVVSSCREMGVIPQRAQPSLCGHFSWGTIKDRRDKPEEVGDDVKSSWLTGMGYTRAKLAVTGPATHDERGCTDEKYVKHGPDTAHTWQCRESGAI